MLCTESRNVVCRMGKYTLCKRVCALLCPEILPRVLRVSGSAAQNELTTCFSLVKSKPTWLHPKELNSEITQSLPMERFAIDVYFWGQICINQFTPHTASTQPRTRAHRHCSEALIQRGDKEKQRPWRCSWRPWQVGPRWPAQVPQTAAWFDAPSPAGLHLSSAERCVRKDRKQEMKDQWLITPSWLIH